MDEKLGRINMSLLPYGQGEVAKTGPSQTIKDVSHLAGCDPLEFRKGTVSAVAEYGLFVNLEGVDGLLHISKMRYVCRSVFVFLHVCRSIIRDRVCVYVFYIEMLLQVKMTVFCPRSYFVFVP